MNEESPNDLLNIKLESQELNHTVMNSLIDEISSSCVKNEGLVESNQFQTTSLTEMNSSVLLRAQKIEVVKNEMSGIEEKNLNTTLMRKDSKGEILVVSAANLKNMELVRDESGMFKCACCWKSFLKKQQLQNHLKIHIGEKNYECEVCHKRFTHKQQLGNHFKIHTGEKNFECEICHKRFTHKQQLQNHIKTHTGVKDFECIYCPKRFTLKQQLQNHLKVHAGLKLFACEFCQKSFTLKQQLGNHMKIHLGIKDFLCSECDKQFRTKQQLERHSLVHLHEKQTGV